MIMRKVVLIIDGYSTGKNLPIYLKNKGYESIHVQSSVDVPTLFTQAFQSAHYVDHTIFESMAQLNGWLKSYQVLAVIAGTETGIFLTDILAETLHLRGNSPKTSALRRDKYLMIQAVNAGGLKTANQFKSNDINQILNWHANQMNTVWPMVVKPLNSAGTDSVRFCYNNDELVAGIHNILGKKNKLGFLNDEVLIQSFLEGQEYVVNTVSCNSSHNLTDVRICHKEKITGAGYVSGSEELLPSHEPIVQALKAYTFRALDHLGIINGPGHFEIMFTQEGPKIIEMGARLQGGVNLKSNAACFEYQQIDKLIDAYLEPERFFSYVKEDYVLKKFGIWVFLISRKIGTLESIPFIENVNKLPSFFSLQMNVAEGDQLLKTIDYYSSPGSVHLVNDDKDQLARDVAQLRQYEAEGFVLKRNPNHVLPT